MPRARSRDRRNNNNNNGRRGSRSRNNNDDNNNNNATTTGRSRWRSRSRSRQQQQQQQQQYQQQQIMSTSMTSSDIYYDNTTMTSSRSGWAADNSMGSTNIDTAATSSVYDEGDDADAVLSTGAAIGSCHPRSNNNNNNNNNNTYVTSPPRKTSGLTGNISSLFRRAGGGGGGRDEDRRGRSNNNNNHNNNMDGSSSSPPSSPRQQQQRRMGPKIVDAGHEPSYHNRTITNNNNNDDDDFVPTTKTKTKTRQKKNNNNNNSNNHHHIEVGRNRNRLFYSNADDDDSVDSFESRHTNRSIGLSTTATDTDGGGGVSSSGRYSHYTTDDGDDNDDDDDDDDDDEYYDDDNDDDDYDDGTGIKSYSTGATSGASQSSRPKGSRRWMRKGERGNNNKHKKKKRGTNGGGGGTKAASDGHQRANTTILRYRGFSTSVKSLFLDEALVCASMGCFGLILSNRTEHLLQLRNDRRGVHWGGGTGGNRHHSSSASVSVSSSVMSLSASRRTLPSRIVAYALLLTLFLIGITFVIWGFGSTNGDGSARNPFRAADQFNGGYKSTNNNSNGNSNNKYSAYDDAINNAPTDDGKYNNNDDATTNTDDGGAAAVQDDTADDAYYSIDDANNNANDDGRRRQRQRQRRQRQLDRKMTLGEQRRRGEDTSNSHINISIKNDNKSWSPQPHRINGIFKIRDVQEGLWEPAIDFLSDEWYRPYEQQQKQQQQGHPQQRTLHHHRRSNRFKRVGNNNNYNVRHLEQQQNGGGGGIYSSDRNLAADIRVSLILAFLIVLGILGRRRRMRTRYYLVRARAQEDHLFYASSGTGIKRVGFQDSREDQYEGACSHTLCGCYPTDPPREGDEIDDDVQVGDDGVSQRKKKPHHEDCVGRAFNCLMGLCCGFVCKCWFQCLSICALAQEAREIRLLVPTRFQRVDYITHQPFHEYQKEVNDLRKGWLGKTRKKAGIMPHFNALSRLSRYIIVLSLFCLIVIVATLLFNPRASFSWPDAVILLATILQSFLVLWIVHWIFHKSDLSLDGVVKFFAAGFVIAVPSAFIFEGILVNLTLSTAYFLYWLGSLIGQEVFVNWVVTHYRLLWILGEIFNAYVVAAVTEELCKYYTFRCVEHPDLIFLTGLVATTTAQDDRAHEGGVVKYPFSSHQVQRTNSSTRNPYDDDVSVRSHRSTGGKDARLDPNPSEDEFYEDEHDVRTYRQRAAAVTTAMISVAVGLACAENFLYVFLLGGTGSENSSNNGGGGYGGGDNDAASAVESAGGYLEEWIVLLFRSIFPVHALAAAMQSVNMIRKFVESDDANGHRIGVGRIILPAVIMHGSFDAVLLGINVFIETSWDTFYNNGGNLNNGDPPPYNPVVVNVVAWMSITLVLLAGIFWYYRENRNQRARLVLLEERDRTSKENNNNTYKGPRSTIRGEDHLSEMEMV